MKNRFANSGLVFVDEGKAGALNDIDTVQFPTQRFDKGGFTCSHRTVKGKYPRFRKGTDQLPGDLTKVGFGKTTVFQLALNN